MTPNNTFAGFDLDKIYEQDQKRIKEEAEKAEAEQRKQALKDKLAGKKKSGPKMPPAKSDSPAQQPPQGQPVSVSAYFVKPGRFSAGSITKAGATYVFHDVELPMGCWNELTLQETLLPGGSKMFDDWAKVTARGQPVGVTPADIRYGLKTICYLKKNDAGLKDVIAEIRTKVWIPDATKNYPHNATSIGYVADQPAGIIPGVGWPQGHPFAVQYSAAIAGPGALISAAAARNDATIAPALEGLVGENDPSRAQHVIEWGMNATPAKLWRCTTDFTGKRVVVFGVGSGYAVIGAGSSDDDLRPARGVRADAKNFHRK